MQHSRGSLQGVGFYDRLKWAVYDPTTGGRKEPQINNAPTTVALAQRIFTPFHTPTAEELVSCKCVVLWWAKVQNRKQEMRGTVHIVVDPKENTTGKQQTKSSASRDIGRKQLLLADVTADMQPMSYFDCTVEVQYTWLYNPQKNSLIPCLGHSYIS